MKNDLNKEYENLGWVITNHTYDAPFEFKKEFIYYLKRVVVDILSIVPFLIALSYLWIKNLTYNPKIKNKILLGTHPLINFKNLQPVLQRNFECDLLVFDDWTNGNFHDGAELKNILPFWLLKKEPYLFGGYYGVISNLCKYSTFGFYADSGFLERTIWWRLEPVIYQLFSKKVLLFPYMGSNYDLYKASNKAYKLGVSLGERKYFALDQKRVKRIYWWSKYVNFVFCYSNLIDFIPRCDALAISGNVLNLPTNEASILPIVDNSIKILHVSNLSARKGSKLIEDKMSRIMQINPNVNYTSYSNLTQKEFLTKMQETHIYVEQLIDGIFSYSAVEAMLLGKVVVAYVDTDLIEFYKTISPKYYNTFFKEFPLVIVTKQNFEESIVALIKNIDNYPQHAKQSYQSAKKLIQNNEKVYLKIFQKVINDGT